MVLLDDRWEWWAWTYDGKVHVHERDKWNRLASLTLTLNNLDNPSQGWQYVTKTPSLIIAWNDRWSGTKFRLLILRRRADDGDV